MCALATGVQTCALPVLDRLRAAHPGLRANAAHPVGETRHEAEILDDVLFADQPHRDNATGSDGDGRTEEAFEHEDALGMVAKRTMAKVGGDRLGLVEPLVEREVVLRSEEHTSELQSLMRNSYAVFCLEKKTKIT